MATGADANTVSDLEPASWRLSEGRQSTHEEANQVLQSAHRWELFANRDFANSAYYMGTKKALIPAIMLCAQDWMPEDVQVLDLMCGSGIVAGAFAQTRSTFASDALEFCRLLARVQGAGYSGRRAEALLERLKPAAQDQMANLTDAVGDVSEAEKELFRIVDSDVLAKEYSDFVRGFPGDGVLTPASRMKSGGIRGGERGVPERGFLFTTYYSNMFFGVRQAMEIDSLRIAIDSIADATDREWALGALVASVSAVATTYAGHFAQPPAPEKQLASPDRVRKVVNRRSMSVAREFEARFLALSSASESAQAEIKLIDGPWQSALADPTVRRAGPLAVYVDPPYRREEFSRYYHVLETLVRYDYPPVSGAARVPLKGSHRFASEFHTRNAHSMRERVESVLGAVLAAGHVCLWSYSDSASASASEIIEHLAGQYSRARSVAVGHSYARQGGRPGGEARGRGPLNVSEFLVYLEP